MSVKNKECPRCGEHHLEVFNSHEYCANCNYGNCFVSARPHKWIYGEDILISQKTLTKSINNKNPNQKLTRGA